MTSRGVAEFVGVSREPGRGIREGVGPYEFFTPDGVLVYLHDTHFRGLVWLPGAEARFYFVFDPEWTPAGAKSTPVIELTFSKMQVSLWETDMDAIEPTESRGQVSDFAWDGGHGFDLSTFTLHLSFSAARMEARLLEALPDLLG